MAHKYYNALKPFIHEEILKSAEENNYTGSKVAQLLGVVGRSGSDIMTGQNMCSCSAMLAYLIRMCTDVDKFLKAASEIIDKVEKDSKSKD